MARFTTIVSFALLATTAMALPSTLPAKRQDTACADVHIFLARGWNETYPGRQGKLAGAICYGQSSCDYEDVQFTTGDNIDYCLSINQGQSSGQSQMQAYAARCPSSKLVLSGYSQGAHVAGNILGGGESTFWDQQCTIDASPALDPSTGAGSQLVAALLFGDVLHNGGQVYNILSGAAYSSSNPRLGDSLTNLNKFSAVLRSYCQEPDPVCAAAGPGPFDVDDHLNYFDLYSDDAAGWAKWMIENPQM